MSVCIYLNNNILGKVVLFRGIRSGTTCVCVCLFICSEYNLLDFVVVVDIQVTKVLTKK